MTDSATGRTTTYYYDFIDRMMKYVETGEGYSHTVGYEYDDINNLTKLVETINGTEYSTAYTYDKDNRVTKVESGEASKEYTYDGFGRVGTQTTKKGETTVKTDTYSFTDPSIPADADDDTPRTSSQVSGHTIDTAGYDKAFTYEYDGNGNITVIKEAGEVVASYVYDTANQLIRENNQAGGYTYTWTYDNAGNILNRKEYAYTTGELTGTPTTVTYSYDDTSWGDLLTSYNGQSILTDSIGNPVHDGTWSYSWQHGRQLARMEGKPGNDPDDTTNPYISIDYTYNADGIRTQKEVTTYSLQDVGTKSGIYLCSDGEIRYFTNGELTSSGLIKDENDNYYYIRSSLVAVRGQEYWVTNTNGLIEQGSYYFAPDGRMVVDLGHGDDGELFTGLRTDADGETRYYMNGVPTYAGLMLINGDYYYFNSSKKAVRNCTYTVTKTNDLLPEGEYTFDADGKMVQTSAVMTMAATSSYQVWAPNTTTTYNYVYNGDKLSQLTVGAESLTFTYDASGSPLSVIYDDTADTAAGTTYYYVTNIQGDVIAIVNDSGTAVVEYAYDAWGNPIGEVSGTMATTLGTTNPLRYRGYVHDSETQYYYLQSRYYDPDIGRFLNADNAELLGANDTLISYNLYAYCGNNPVARKDDGGEFWNFVIGGVVGGAIGGITAALSSYKESGTVNWSAVALGTVTGAVGGIIGASGMPAVGQAVASGLLSAANNVGSSLIAHKKIDWGDVAIDAAIGTVSSALGSAATKKLASAAKTTIAKGINRVASGKARFDNGSRYWKGAMKRGMRLIARGVADLNFAQGSASVIGSEIAGIASIAKMWLRW